MLGNTHSTYMLNYKFVSVPTAKIFEFPFCSSIILSERVVNWSATETGSNKRERRDRERNWSIRVEREGEAPFDRSILFSMDRLQLVRPWCFLRAKQRGNVSQGIVATIATSLYNFSCKEFFSSHMFWFCFIFSFAYWQPLRQSNQLQTHIEMKWQQG